MKVVLHLTKACNLRCRYCYAPAKTAERMSFETACKAVDLALSLGQKSACVSYFGGEPLLTFDLIREITAYAEEAAQNAQKSIFFRLSTNGLLLDDDILRFCREHRIPLALSLDGDPIGHDLQRPKANGDGSFAILDAKLDAILAGQPRCVAVGVITPAIVERFYDGVLYLWNRGLRVFSHQPAYDDPSWRPEHLVALEAQYRRLANFYLARAKEGENFHLSLFDNRLDSHLYGQQARPGDKCDFGVRKLSIAADGSIYPCVQFVSDKPEAAAFVMGNVHTALNETRRRELIALNKAERPDCTGCALVGRCSQYCGCVNWQTTGSVTSVSPFLCAHERMLFPIVDALGNRLWDERNPFFLAKHLQRAEKEGLLAYPLD